VLFIHSEVASTALTCSGSLMLQSLFRCFSRLSAVCMVSSALPFFFMSNA